MQYHTHQLLTGIIGAGLVLGSASVALALTPTDYTLFDGAQYVSPGENSARAVQLVSNASTTDSGIDYGLGGTLTLADIQNLSTDYNFVAGTCGGGSPRFQINLQTTSGLKNVFVYFGSSPNFNDCPTGTWASTGNLVGSGTVDTSQLGGSPYDTWANALANYGSYPVTGIQLVADGGWNMPTTGQVVNVDNTTINNTLYTYEATSTPPTSTTVTNKQQCMKGGWQTLTDANGNGFKNQGDCVSFVASGGKNNGSVHQ